MNENGNKYGKVDFFDLREKRLKLVYKILYVVVAIWIASLLNINDEALSTASIPFFAALLAVSSLIIINIIKYALLEFRCMKVAGKIEDEMLKQTENKYDNIWNSFEVILSVSALLMFAHIYIYKYIEPNDQPAIFEVSFGVCSFYFFLASLLDFFKPRLSVMFFKILEIISIFVGIINAYSVCAWLGLVIIL